MTNGFGRLLSGLIVIAALLHTPGLAASADKVGRPGVATPPAVLPATAKTVWTSRETGITVTLPPGWHYFKDEQYPVFFKGKLEALLVCEATLKQVKSLATYAADTRKFLATLDITLPAFQATDDKDLMTAIGADTARDVPEAIVVGKGSTHYCRLHYMPVRGADAAVFIDPEMTESIFTGLGKPPAKRVGQVNPDTQMAPVPKPSVTADPNAASQNLNFSSAGSKTWTNPRTGQSFALPGTWVAHIEGEGTLENVSFTNYQRQLELTYFFAADLEDTIEELAVGLAKRMTDIELEAPFAPLETAGAKGIWRASGVKETGEWASIYIKRVGEKKYGYASFADVSKRPNGGTAPIGDLELLSLLFGSDQSGTADGKVVTPPAPTASATTPWTNPQTGQTVFLPDGWTSDGDQQVLGFTNPDGRIAFLECEVPLFRVPTVKDYLPMARDLLTKEKGIGEFQPTAIPNVMQAFGSEPEFGVPVTVFITTVGQNACSLHYLMTGAVQNDDPALTAALFKSADGAQPKRNVSTVWTNPRSGRTVDIPAGWEAIAMRDEQNAFRFANPDVKYIISYSALDNLGGLTIAKIAKSMPKLYKDTEWDAPFKPFDKAKDIWRGTGTDPDGARQTYYISMIDGKLALIAFTDFTPDSTDAIESPFTTLLFDSEEAP